MISNLHLIENIELKNDILKLRENIIDIFSNLKWDEVKQNEKVINDALYKYVLGIGHKICICDGNCVYADMNFRVFCKQYYKIELLVNYQVVYCYDPSHLFDKPVYLAFKIDKSDLRENRLEKLGI
jgi:hypothetical protein